MFKDLTSEETMHSLLIRMVNEVTDDRSWAFEMANSYSQFLTLNKKMVTVLSENILVGSSTLVLEAMLQLSAYINNFINSVFASCYGGFFSVTYTIVYHKKMILLVDKTKAGFPE